ncbi:hypothetical protein TRFO_30197 [Tritrichomonas foetus]|uniref:Uncharacterized protein n=1 Tax=Tritrichomonas foetus TaxID=1144522 RepID=A0A1J4JUI2_9EUKA|nr:hypothetical protein TRFO_30197 [Tritrichomonas foetus]|eukprot:OHT02659.1 hypothetical protein TRFO_30197 [Tritrichomonas foetus]
MFFEENALSSIDNLVETMLSNLNEDTYEIEKTEYKKNIIFFRDDPIHNAKKFQEEMKSYMKNLIKISATPNPNYVFATFIQYLENYISAISESIENKQLNDSDDINEEEDDEEVINGFLRREKDKKTINDYFKFAQIQKAIQIENDYLMKEIVEYENIAAQLSDETIEANAERTKSELDIVDDTAIDETERRAQHVITDLMLLIDQMNFELGGNDH